MGAITSLGLTSVVLLIPCTMNLCVPLPVYVMLRGDTTCSVLCEWQCWAALHTASVTAEVSCWNRLSDLRRCAAAGIEEIGKLLAVCESVAFHVWTQVATVETFWAAYYCAVCRSLLSCCTLSVGFSFRRLCSLPAGQCQDTAPCTVSCISHAGCVIVAMQQ